MSASSGDLDPAFKEAGKKAGLEIWRIEDFKPVPIPKASFGKFFTGDSYIVLKTTALKSGAFRHDIHFWLGKDTSQDEAGAAAIKTVELDAALGDRAVQYREVQGNETEKFLSYFKPCIIPQPGGVASGFKHVKSEEHQTRLFICKGKRVVQVKEVPFAERGKAFEVVQYIKDTYHDGKCDNAVIKDEESVDDAETEEFWGFFGGFVPLPEKTTADEDNVTLSDSVKLFCIDNGQARPIEVDSLKKELLDGNKCYILDCGVEAFVWIGKNTSLDERKSASVAAEELVKKGQRPNSHIIRVTEGSETVMFRSKFDSWPRTDDDDEDEDD
ncbi:villin putative [Euphorbia peplus]|nr:villin putative [Euphorbia peplus]